MKFKICSTITSTVIFFKDTGKRILVSLWCTLPRWKYETYMCEIPIDLSCMTTDLTGGNAISSVVSICLSHTALDVLFIKLGTINIHALLN